MSACLVVVNLKSPGIDMVPRPTAFQSVPKRSSKKNIRDINVLAAHIVEEATKEPTPKPEDANKNPAAVALGRLGGLKGGKARAAKLTPEQRKEIAQKAAKIRWANK